MTRPYCPRPRRDTENPWSLAAHFGLFTAVIIAGLTFAAIAGGY